MNIDTINQWLPFGLAIWNLGITAALWLRKPGEDANAALQSHKAQNDARLASIDTELAVIKSRLDDMPTSGELARLEGVVRQLDERTKGQSDTMDTVRHQLNRIESYLLEGRR